MRVVVRHFDSELFFSPSCLSLEVRRRQIPNRTSRKPRVRRSHVQNRLLRRKRNTARARCQSGWWNSSRTRTWLLVRMLNWTNKKVEGGPRHQLQQQQREQQLQKARDPGAEQGLRRGQGKSLARLQRAGLQGQMSWSPVLRGICPGKWKRNRREGARVRTWGEEVDPGDRRPREKEMYGRPLHSNHHSDARSCFK